MKKQILAIFLMLCTLFSWLHAEFEVKSSRSVVGLNESFSVDFTSRRQPSAQPDFSPLHENFQILSCGQSASIKMMNQTTTREDRWNLVLQPKTEGELTIPSIACGNERSQAITIQVTAPSIIRQDDSLILEAEISPKECVYERAQAIYKLKLYQSVNLAQSVLSEVQTNDSDAIVERLGNDNAYEVMHPNGRRYVVLERKYAVFPQHEGELVFSPIVLDAKVIKGTGSFFNVQTEHKRVLSNPVTLTVKPIPSSLKKNDRFPANHVKLQEEWSGDPDKMIVGEPITWTITLTADGCMGNQIPPVAFEFPHNVKHYADKPEISDKISDRGFVGTKQMKFALIASDAGEIILPELKVKWWDVTNRQESVAVLPGRTLYVQESPIAMNTITEPVGDQVEVPQHSQDAVPGSPSLSEIDRLPAWAWGLIGLNFMWILILSKGRLRKFFAAFSFKSGNSGPLPGLKNELKNACKSNDAKTAETLLLKWLAIRYPQARPQNLPGIKPHLPLSFQEAIDELHDALYGHKKNWNGAGLWQEIVGLKSSNLKSPDKKLEHLKELY